MKFLLDAHLPPSLSALLMSFHRINQAGAFLPMNLDVRTDDAFSQPGSLFKRGAYVCEQEPTEEEFFVGHSLKNKQIGGLTCC